MISRILGLHDMHDSGVHPGRPRAIKLVDCSLTYYWRTRQIVGDGCLIDVRWYEPHQALDDPERRAQEWWERRKAFILAIPAAENVVYEGYNEIGDAEAAAHCRFEVERLRLLHQQGRRACVLNASVGTPSSQTAWGEYAPMLASMHSTDVVGLHEYWVDEEGIDNRWHVGRFTLPEVARWLQGKRLLITEAGRDIINDPGLPPDRRGAPGWQLTCDADQCLRDLRKAAAFYAAQPNVAGVVIFQAGSWDREKWGAFDVADLWPRVVAEYPPEEEAPVTTIPYFHSSRQGHGITHVILHNTEGSADAAEAWFRNPNNPYRSSAHVIVRSSGEIMRLIPDELAAHHAGYGSIPG